MGLFSSPFEDASCRQQCCTGFSDIFHEEQKIFILTFSCLHHIICYQQNAFRGSKAKTKFYTYKETGGFLTFIGATSFAKGNKLVYAIGRKSIAYIVNISVHITYF